jgi:hypothetical protein
MRDNASLPVPQPRKTSMKENNLPPSNSIRISRIAELPPLRDPATYVIRNSDDEPRHVCLSKRKRQVTELLMQGPVHCASPVRLSDIVFILREEVGLNVETKMYPGDSLTGAGSYGVYFLISRVERAEQPEVAA